MSIFKKEELLSSNRFEVLDSLGEEVLILDPDYKIVYANQKFLDNREKSFSEVKGRFCYQISHNLDKPCPVSDEVCPLNKVLKNSAPVKVIHKDDGRYMEIDASPLKNKEGKIIGIVEILRDVTEKEREKRESEEKYKNLVEKSNDAILILQHNRIKLANQKFLDLTGYSWEEIERSDFMEGIAPESRDMVLDRYLRRQKGEEVPDHYEFTILTKDGKRKEVEAGVAIIEYQGKVASYCFLKDVTAKKKAEDELKKVKDYLDNMISTSQVAITVIDNEGSFSIFNQGAEKLTGYKAEEVIGKKKLSDFCPDKEELEYIQTKLLEEGLIENFETTLLKRDGSIVPVSISVSLLKDLQGKSIGSLGISTGIAERKKAEQEIFRQNAVLGAINKVLQETLVCETDEEVARKCLAVAEELTNSKFGFIGEVNQAGHFDTIALSDPGWDACRMPKSEAVVMIKDMEIRGIWGRVLKDRKSLIVNHPVSHPDRVGTPEGHPPITSFLGVLLKHAGRSIGMIGLANKEFGYDSADQEAIEALSVAFVEALYRKRAEDALRKSEEKYRFLYEKSPTVNLIIGIDGKIKDINESAIKKFGYSKDEIIGKQALEFVVPEQRGKVASQLERDFKGEYTPEIDVDINAKDGSIHTILFSPGNIILYEGGQPTSILITGIDITERKKAEEALRRSEERFRHFASAITDVICRYDPLNNRYDFISPSFERQTGYPLDEINQDPQGFMRKITHPEDVERVFSEVDAHIKKGPGAGQICTEYRLIRKNGEVIWVSDRKDIEFDSEGKVYRINGVVRDITQRKKAEEEIYYLKEFNQEIVEKLPIGVIRLDKEGEIVYENPKMREILGVEKGGKSKALGMKITQMTNVIESDTVKPLENLLTGTPFAYLVIPFISLYGKKTILSINGVPLFDQIGKPDGAILLIEDITESKKIEQKIIQANKELSALNSIASIANQSLNLDLILKETIDKVLEVTDCQAGGIYILNQTHQELDLKACKGLSLETVKGVDRLKLGEGFSGRIALTGEPIMVEDIVQDPRLTRSVMKKEGLHSYLGVPLKSKGKILGTIFVINQKNRRYNSEEVQLLLSIGNQIGMAVENAHLFKEAQQWIVQLEAIRSITNRLNKLNDVKAVASSVMEEIKKVIDFDNCRVFLLSENKDELIPVAFGSEVEEYKGETEEVLRLKIGEGITGWVAQTGEPQVIDDGERHPRSRHISGSPYVDESMIVSPMIYEGEVRGVITLSKLGLKQFNQNHLALLNILANEAVVAIENAKLFESLKQAYAKLKEAQEQLIQSEKLRALGEMAGGVAHDFNNLLGAILGRAQLLLLSTQEKETKKGLSVIEKAALDGAETVRRIQEFTRLRTDENFTMLDLNEILKESLEITKHKWKDEAQKKGILIQVETNFNKNLAPVAGNPSELREVFVNMILNSLDAMPEGGTLTISSQSNENHILASVTDTGIGMSEEVKRKVFDPFFTTKGPKGNGLGMSLAYGIIVRHNGEILIKSQEGKGATFTVKLPKRKFDESKRSKEKISEENPPENVLIIDDEPAIRELLCDLLRSKGHQAMAVDNSLKGIELFKKGEFGIVFTDLSMPEMSGWEVAERLKSLKPEVVVVMVTGWGTQVDSKKLKAHSVDLLMAKPFEVKKFFEILSQALKIKKDGGKKRLEKISSH